MHTEQLIHDTRRLPDAISTPVFVAGLVALWLAADVVSTKLFGYNLPPFIGKGSGSPILGFVVALALGLFMISVPFLRNRIFYDSDENQVLVRHSGLFGRSKRTIPLASATAVEIEVGYGAHGSVQWNIWIRRTDRGPVWVTMLRTVDEADAVGRSLSQAARLSLIRT